jgi:4'-phosphopantetheinyl transferase
VTVLGPVRVASARVPDGPGPLHDRARAAAGDLLAQLLRSLGSDDVRVLRQCEVCGSTGHGRPVAASGTALVSVSYAADRVVAVAAPASAGRAVGVDIEAIRGSGPMSDLAALFAPAPPPDVRGWTAIEAALKADGRGLRVPPGLVVAHPELAGDVLPGGHRIAVPGRGTRIEVVSAPAPEGFAISVAIDPGSESGP